jgi:HPt (histidine-containing phosphotransfer) domain-containing protein
MDFKSLGDNLGLEEDEFLEIVELFIDTANNDFKKIQKAVSDDNSNLIAESSHSLKGAAGNLGFKEISGNAEFIEKIARSGKIDGFDVQLSDIQKGLKEIKNKLG